ncbi:MAG: tRNA (N6-isopentenyl adenosine(37)-C2)-methylthiotransferase MiaB [Candidatus Omnitrophica bacterium]|nr:tRNA (N6-isopentenyl adenosine(37)-C2)-methylthiotransferase MiaB [Candidatus Omnitrophota bacterium]
MINNTLQKKIFIETYGCQMNEYDSELVRSILKKENYEFVTDELKADIVMLNTCAIREHAHRVVYGRVYHIRHLRGKDNPVMIGILGCMATNLRQELLENRNLKIDFIAGPDSYKRLPQLIREAMDTGQKAYDVTLSEFETYSDITPSRKEGVNAWIAVMRGCNNFCTFCVVPYTRGRERSRSPQNVVEEVRRLSDEGFKQVTLLGQNVNSYRYEDYDFAYLLEEVSKVDGLERIRFTSPHPKDFPDRLLEIVANNPKVCKHIHLPLQAGNNRILDLMNRTYTREEFLGLVDKMRALIPHVALSTDIIIGFCSETEAEFEETLDVVRRVEFDSAFTFKYSQRKGTIASKKYPDDVPDNKKTDRIMRLNDLQKEISYRKNQAHIGQVQEILIDAASANRSQDQIPGRTDGNQLVMIPPGPYKVGDLVKVRITDATPHALKGAPMFPEET